MAERRSPLDGLLPWSLPADVVTLTELRFPTQISLRLRPARAEIAGIPLSLAPNRVAASELVRTLWLGPDEWLVTAPDGAVPGLGEGLAAVVGGGGTVLDLSAGRAVVVLGGTQARALIAKGCGLDLHPRVFGPCQCAQSLLAGVPVILDQIDAAPTYRVFVARSKARWLCRWLIDAAEEFRALTS